MVNNLKSIVNIVHHKKIDGTPVAGMYFRFKVDQMDKYPDIEYCGRMGYRPNWSAIAAYTSGKLEPKTLIGAIVFYCPPETNGMHICAAYIYHMYRNNKIYERLWEELLQHARELGVSYIDSSTHRDNDRMKELYRKQGRLEMGTFHYLKVSE